MINAENISFPITGKQIAELQRSEVGRELTLSELELFAEIAEMANEAYEAAAHGDAETVQDLLYAINRAPVPDDYTRHIAALCRGWVLLGCRKGMEVLEETFIEAAFDDTIYS